jgi:hypothetical protein
MNENTFDFTVLQDYAKEHPAYCMLSDVQSQLHSSQQLNYSCASQGPTVFPFHLLYKTNYSVMHVS